MEIRLVSTGLFCLLYALWKVNLRYHQNHESDCQDIKAAMEIQLVSTDLFCQLDGRSPRDGWALHS